LTCEILNNLRNIQLHGLWFSPYKHYIGGIEETKKIMKICPSYYIKQFSQYGHAHEKCDQLEQAICGACGTFLCICGLKTLHSCWAV
jgi:hypothetical protein